MKAFAILPMVAVAIMALNISAASSQGACSKDYQGCMDYCASRPSKTTQGSCINSCEVKNNSCAEGIYGKRPANGVTPVVAAPQVKAKDALAKTEKKAESEPAQPQAAEAEKTPAPEPRAPARR